MNFVESNIGLLSTGAARKFMLVIYKVELQTSMNKHRPNASKINTLAKHTTIDIKIFAGYQQSFKQSSLNFVHITNFT
jgi:hypothetical protein